MGGTLRHPLLTLPIVFAQTIDPWAFGGRNEGKPPIPQVIYIHVYSLLKNVPFEQMKNFIA